MTQTHLQSSITDTQGNKSAARRIMHGALWHVFLGSRGGDQQPLNAHRLKVLLDLDYSTIRHSLRVLEKNRVVEHSGEEYGGTYDFTAEFQNESSDFRLLIPQDEGRNGYGKQAWNDRGYRATPTIQHA